MRYAHDDINNYKDLLPEGALPTSGIRILTYMDSEGRNYYRCAQVGQVAVTQLLGVLELVKNDFVTNATKKKTDE